LREREGGEGRDEGLTNVINLWLYTGTFPQQEEAEVLDIQLLLALNRQRLRF
jgi:hypothetical protein